MLSGSDKISAATRQRVLEASERLGWQPNALARSLSRSQSNILGVVISTGREAAVDPLIPQLIRALVSAAQAHGFRLLLAGAEGGEAGIDRALEMLGSRAVDGVLALLTFPGSSATITALQEPERPLLFLGQPAVAAVGLPWVDVDFEGMTREAVDYLIALGHRRIAFLGEEPGPSASAARLRGYTAALHTAGLPLDPALVWDAPHERLLQAKPTALFATSDLIAAELLSKLLSEGWRVPEELSIIAGTDGAVAAHLSPPLTATRVPVTPLAERATDLLAKLISGEATWPIASLVPGTLILRASTAPPSTSS